MGSKLTPALFALLCLSSSLHGQWINSPGKFWIDASLHHQDTRQQFWFDGSEIELFEDGHVVTSSAYFTTAYGLIKGMDVWIQLPFIRSAFNDLAGERLSTGLGDPRFFLRIGPQLFSDMDFPIALRFGVKAPIGSFEKDAEIIPLGEGQMDMESHLEIGYSDPLGRYFSALSLGYRYRLLNKESGIQPGDEFVSLMTLGVSHKQLTADLLSEILIGDAPRIQGLNIETAKRRMVQLTPRLGYVVSGSEVKVGLRWPLSGRNLPSGKSLYFGIFRKL